jgi:type II secretory pathway component PulF
MPTYRYTARYQNGFKTEGNMAAQDIDELRKTLRHKGLFLTKYEEVRKERAFRGLASLFHRRSHV